MWLLPQYIFIIIKTSQKFTNLQYGLPLYLPHHLYKDLLSYTLTPRGHLYQGPWVYNCQIQLIFCLPWSYSVTVWSDGWNKVISTFKYKDTYFFSKLWATVNQEILIVANLWFKAKFEFHFCCWEKCPDSPKSLMLNIQ